MRINTRPLAIAAAAAAIAITARANADVKYTTEMKVGGGAGRPGGGISVTHYYKGANERTETHIKFGPMDMTLVTLTLCAKEQTYTLDPNLKIYKVAPVGAPALAAQSFRGMRGGAGAQSGQMTGKSDTTFTVQDLGQETVANLPCTHSKLTIHSVTSGCLGDADRTSTIEVWSAPGTLPSGCPARFMPSRDVTTPTGCKMTYTLHGDIDKMKALMGGIITRMIVTGPNGQQMTQQLTDISRDPLDDALFTIPADYKELPAADYDSQEQKAMMDRIMKLRGGGPGGPPPAP
ncbi:MAG: hypothetical protein KGJ62_01700 [Armatimonadetes bacterium]|nr:hypothetical protein [Armatimonadota bacterium]MDE2205494.1 hypothetical protein [Armatimonadota bacterium]